MRRKLDTKCDPDSIPTMGIWNIRRVAIATRASTIRAAVIGALLAMPLVAARAQTVTIRPPSAAAAEAMAKATPPHSTNCGYRNAPPAWGYGAVFVDTLGLNTKSLQQVAAGWCVYLASALFQEPVASFTRWSDAQLADDITIDPGIEWARTSSNGGRIRFDIAQVEQGATERFLVKTAVETPDSTGWRTRAVHTIGATVYHDTVRFESALVPRLTSAMRWVASPLEFVRLDTGVVDTVRANAAAAFVRDIRRRVGIPPVDGEQVLYLYTKSGNGSELLGFSKFTGAVDGFTSTSPKFLFANVPLAGEFYRHELVHVALMARTPRLDSELEEALSKTLGGTLQRDFRQFVCEERSLVLKPAAVADLPAFFAVDEGLLESRSLRTWENAFFIDFMIAKSGDAALRKLIDTHFNARSREATQAAIAGIMGISVAELARGVGEYYSEKSIAQRCATK